MRLDELREIAAHVRWLVRIRWVAIGAAATILILAHALVGEPAWLDTIALAFVLGVLAIANTALGARRRPPTEGFLLGQFILDVVAITIALHLSGGVENPFQVYYLFPVITAGIVLPRPRAYAVATLAAALFACTGVLEWAKVVPHHDVGPLPLWGTDASSFDQFADARYVAGASTVLFSTLLVATYLTTEVSSRLRAKERELVQSRDRVEAILRGLGEGVGFFDADGALVLENEAFRRLLPVGTGSGPLGRAPAGLRAPLEAALERLGRGDDFVAFEAEDGRRLLSCGLSAVRGARGVAWVVEEITERRQAEQRRAAEQRLADLGVLAAGIAHEVLNPLASLSSTIQVVAAEGGSEVGREATQMRRQVDRIVRIVRAISDLARPDGASSVASALDDVLADAVARAREEKPGGAQVSIEVDRPSSLVAVAEEPLRIAVKNLVSNAIDAAGDKGHVSVRGRRQDGDVLIDVEDDGPGVAPEDLKRLFVPFFTTKPQGRGLGLGLPIALGIARQHGGAIDVASSPGRGTRFTMRLPAAGGSR